MRLKFTTLAILLSVLFTGWLNAQVTTSSIAGVIKDQSNAPLEGATVSVTHLPTGSQYGTITQSNGSFNIYNMRPGGPYKIEVSYIGYETKTVDNVMLVLGETYIINGKLAESGQQIEEVQVIGEKSFLLNSDRTGASTNINSRTLNRLPSFSRSITDFTRLAPQANGNGFAGRDGRFNNLQIDGANFNNGFGLSSDPLPGGGNQPISLDAIEEVQINVAPYDVRQTGFTGAGINAVTRSGTNEFTGSVYGFFRPKSFNGLKVGDNKLNENVRTSSVIGGARLGGPIIKNKLFFFANFEYENKESAGNTWIAARPGVEGQNVARTTAEDLELVRNHLITKYGYDPGRYENYAPTYNNKNIKALLRLDWNINNNNKLTLKYNQMSGTNDQGANANSGPNPRAKSARISLNSISFENANYSFKNTVSSLTAELNSSINNKMSNQFLATYSRIQDTRTTPGSIFPFVDIWKDGDNYMSFGTELFSYNNDVINHNFTFTDNLSYVMGKNAFTAGVSFQTMSYGNSYLRMGTSYYRYKSVQDFINDSVPTSFGITYPYEGQETYAKVKFGLAGIYIQDKLTLTDRLNITLGIRADMAIFLDKPLANPVVDTLKLLDKDGNQTTYTTAQWPKSVPLFSPRVGFNYDVKGDRTLQLRGGTGIFTGNIPFVWFTNMPTNAGVIQNTLEPVDNATLAKITRFDKDPYYWVNQLPASFPKQPNTKAPGSLALVDRDFKMPQVWRSNIGAEYKLGASPLVASMDLIYTKDLVGIYQFNANRKAASSKLNYAGDNRDYWVNSGNARYNPATGAIIPVLSNTDKGYSAAATLGVSLNNWKGLSGGVFYTYTDSRDITGNPGSAAGSAWSNNYSVNDPNEQLLGYSQYAVPHRVVGNLSYRIEYADHLATTFSVFYQGSNQGRFAYTYANDINSDGVTLDLLYIPNNSSELNFADIKDSKGEVLYSIQQQKDAFDKFVAGDKGLSNSKGKYVDRNSGLMPWFNRWDVRIMQDIFTNIGKNNRRQTLQISLDIINVANLLNSKWGVYKQLNAGSDYNYGLLRVSSVTPEGVPTFTMNTITDSAGKTVLPDSPYRDNFGVVSTWGMQLGLRYIF